MSDNLCPRFRPVESSDEYMAEVHDAFQGIFDILKEKDREQLRHSIKPFLEKYNIK